MITARSLIAFLILCFYFMPASASSNIDVRANYAALTAEEDRDIPLTTDSRIRTYIYSPNNVYLLVLHFGFQSHVEFAKDEEVHTISLGDSYAWKITPIENRLFIKPMEKNIRTNMTIITNKRTYQFDLISQVLEDENDDVDLVYLIKFVYPKKQMRAR